VRRHDVRFEVVHAKPPGNISPGAFAFWSIADAPQEVRTTAQKMPGASSFAYEFSGHFSWARNHSQRAGGPKRRRPYSHEGEAAAGIVRLGVSSKAELRYALSGHLTGELLPLFSILSLKLTS
jgi:hypothetical protein